MRRPCKALTIQGSPRPSETNSQASVSRRSLSTLLATSITGVPARTSTRATSSSSLVTPTAVSTTCSTRSADATARAAWPVTFASRESPPSSQPPVSTTTKVRPFHSASSSTRSRVTPGFSSTTAARRPTMRFTSVDFPTLGRPTMATTGVRPPVGVGPAPFCRARPSRRTGVTVRRRSSGRSQGNTAARRPSRRDRRWRRCRRSLLRGARMRSEYPSLGTTSTGTGSSATVMPSRKRPSDRHTSGRR